MPELKVIELPETIAKYEADGEVQDLLTASLGLTLAVDLLPGALAYDGSQPPPLAEAAVILWLDAFTADIDRTPHNPNRVRWHGETWCIVHGAALYFHHSWPSKGSHPERFDLASHIMWNVDGVAEQAAATHERLSAIMTPDLLVDVLSLVPDA